MLNADRTQTSSTDTSSLQPTSPGCAACSTTSSRPRTIAGGCVLHGVANRVDVTRMPQASGRVGFTVGRGAMGPQPTARARAPTTPGRLLHGGCALAADRRLPTPEQGAGAERSPDAIAAAA